MREEFLLVGGSRDGERVTLKLRRGIPRSILRIPVTRVICDGVSSNVVHDGVRDPVFENYTLRAITGKHENHLVYAIHDMSINTVLKKLLAGYGKP